MAAAAPTLNPNQPYSVVPPAAQPAPAFNPNQPYSVVPPAAQMTPVIDVGGPSQGQYNPSAPAGTPGSELAPMSATPNSAGTGTNVNVIPAGIAPGPGQTNAPAPPPVAPAPAPTPAESATPPVQYIPPAAAPPLSAAPPVPPPAAPQPAPPVAQPAPAPAAPQPAAPGPQLIAPPQSGPPPSGPDLIAPAPPPPPGPPPAPPAGPMQGASDAAFAALDAIPGASQLGALTDAALGYKFGDGSNATTFGQRYQQNLAANLARLQGIPAALRVPAELAGAVGTTGGAGAVLGGIADAARAAVPAVETGLNALTNLPKWLQYAGAGAAQGGLQGASDAQTNADILPGAALGAGTGALTGAILPAVGNAIGEAGRAIGNYTRPFWGKVSALTDEAGRAVLGSDGESIMAKPGQARMAGQRLVSASSDPAAVRSAVAGGSNEIIPGSPRTTAQQTGDRGLLSMEGAVSRQNPEKFAAVRERQNAARTTVLQGMRGSGDPMDVVNMARAQRQAIDDTAQQLSDVTTKARAMRTASIGPDNDPERAGAAMRAPILANELAARAHESALHEAIDPDGKLGMDATAIRRAARDILGSQTPSAAPLSGAESQILKAAADYKPLMPYRDVSQLSQNLSSAMRQELRSAGRTPTYARLSRFKAALENAMDATIERKATKEAAEVASGTRSPEDTMAARLNEEVADWRAKRGQNVAGGNSPGNAGERTAGGGMGGVPGVGRAPADSEGRPGAGGGNSRLASQQADVTDSFDADAAARRQAANAATRDRARTYNAGVVGRITQRGESSDELKLSNEQVPDAILRPGPTGLNALNRYVKAGGSMSAARDALAMKARQTLVSPDGSLNTSKLQAFRTAYNRVLSHPEMAPLNDALKNGEDAEAAVAQAAARTRAATEKFQASAAARFLGAGGDEDVSRTIGSMFGNQNSNSLFQSLAASTKDNPDAIAGVRRAIVNHIEAKVIGTQEAGTSAQNQIKANAVQTFMQRNHDALRQFFTDNEVRTMGLLGLDMREAARSTNAVRVPGGSDTAQNLEASKKFSLLRSIGQAVPVDLTGLIIGDASGGLGVGVISGVGVAAARHFVTSMRNAGLETVSDLTTEALLHPEVARILMAKVTPETAPRILRALQHAVTRAAAVDLGQQAQQ